jgi:SAM-dependent methyltransferase
MLANVFVITSDFAVVMICNSIMVRDKAADCSLDLMSSKTVYEIYRCVKCGYRCLDPFPSDDELSSFYNSDYFEDTARGYSYAEQVVEYNPVFAVTAGIFSKYLKASGTVVDVGCATGEFILFLKKEGFHAVGIELS